LIEEQHDTVEYRRPDRSGAYFKSRFEKKKELEN
jgi:hypothetical protein